MADMLKHNKLFQTWNAAKGNGKYNMLLFLSGTIGLIGIIAAIITISEGLIVWGNTNRTAWGFGIVNFVFWIGIGHAGTLISAILYLLNQNWRVKFNRSAELMTIISLLIAASFPLLHTGRPWFAAYWLFPYYNQMGLMPNFKSPLTWDIFAILTYFIVSCLFLYLGLLPDLAYLKRKISSKFLVKLYNRLSYFWSGSKNQWSQYNTIYLLFAGLAAPLVISVHSVVSFDFYVTLLPAWHSAILPPYFVMGAIFSGLAMVNVFTIIFNRLNGHSSDNIEAYDKMNKLILFSSLGISFVYIIEFSTCFVENSWKSTFLPIINGGLLVYLMLIFNSILPLSLVIKRFRRNHLISFFISIGILLGMWVERYIIIIIGQELSTGDVQNSLSFSPTLVDLALLVGSFGIFLFLMLLMGKILPLHSITEGVNNE